MKKKIGIFSLLLLMSLSFTPPADSQLFSLDTKDLRLVYYDPGHKYVVEHLARCFENALRFHRNLFAYTPTERVTVLLQDFGDYGNGGASAVPRNIISVGISPFHYAYETSPANERMNALMNHELVHIVALDQSTTSDRLFQSVFFGKVMPTKEDPVSMFYSYFTTPRRYSPRWFHEGIAAFLETWMDGGLGRALGSYDEMVFRTMVRDGAYIYDAVGLESEGTTIDFMVKANSYLYGTRFISYIAYKFGPEKLLQWVSRRDGSKRSYAAQFTSVFGSSLDEEWGRWIEWERNWQRANLDSIRLYPVTEDRPLSKRALGSVSRAFYDRTRNEIYAGVNYPGQVAHIAAINVRDGSVRKICDVKGAALYYVCSLAYDPSSGTLFFTTDNNKWRDLNSVNVETGETKLLIKDVRTGDLAFNPIDKSIWGVRHFNGISTLVRIPPPYREWNQVHSLPYGKDIFDIDISPDGSKLTGALAEVNGNQKLVLVEISKLTRTDAPFQALYDFENSSPATFAFSPDGRYLIGSTYFTGVSNVVRYGFEKNEMEWLTNCETGYFRPIPISDDSIIAFRYTGKGFIPVMIAAKRLEDVSAINFLGQQIVEKYPVVTRWKLDPPTPEKIPIDSLTIYSGSYSPGKNLELMSAYPIVEGYKDFPAYGLRLNFSDPLLLHGLDLTASYTPNKRVPSDERWHGSLSYKFWRWKVFGTYNWADFYDLFGPTKKSRKGYSLGIQYKDFFVFDEPKTFDYVITAAYYGNLERLPDFQNVGVAFDKFASANIRFDYQFFMKSLGAVDDEKGIRWQGIAHGNYVNRRAYPRVLTSLDYGILLPLNHSSIWFRTSAGYSFSKEKNSFANFYFGGFGNNWVDYQEARRYREYYSFPGVELNEIGGKNYGKLLLEWTLPPLRFRRVGFLNLYSNWAQLMLFSSAIATNIEKGQDRRAVFNAGAQLDFKLVIFSILESTLSLGYAKAYEKNPPAGKNRWTDEFMISLKLLK